MDNSTNQNSYTLDSAQPNQLSQSASLSSAPPVPPPSIATGGNLGVPLAPPSSTPAKKRKKFDWLIPVAIIIGLCCVAFGAIWQPFTEGFGWVIPGDVSDIRVGNLSAQYSNKIWSLQQEGALESEFSSEAILLKSDFGTVNLIYLDTNPYFYTSSEAALSIKSIYEASGFSSGHQTTSVEINGISWEVLTLSRSDIQNQSYVFAEAYATYVVSVQGDSSTFSDNLKHAQEILSTITFEDADSAESQKNGKQALTGEWQWGKDGYAVISHDDTIIIYQDKNVLGDNYVRGTYVIYDRVPTYGAGYNYDSYDMHITIKEARFDGATQDEAVGNKIEYVFTPQSDGSYLAKNMSTYDTFPVKSLN